MKKLSLGESLPSVPLQDQKGVWRHLDKEYAGRVLLIAFYPGDFTPVCTKEMMCFRDDYKSFLDLGCEILGVSSDTLESHTRFKEQFHLPFDLLSDPEGKWSRQFGMTLPFVKKVNRGVAVFSEEGRLIYLKKEVLPLFRPDNDELLQVLRSKKSI